MTTADTATPPEPALFGVVLIGAFVSIELLVNGTIRP